MTAINHILFFIAFLFVIGETDAQDLLPKQTNGKWGYQNKAKEWVIKPKFEAAKIFTEGLAGVQKKGKWGFVNTEGKMIVKPIYREVGYFSEALAPVKTERLWGFVNAEGIMIINEVFTKVSLFKDGRSLVALPDFLPRQKMQIDPTGKQMTPPYLKKKSVGNDTYLIVSGKKNKDSVYCYINSEGKLLTNWYLDYFELGKEMQKVSVPADHDNDQIPGDVLLGTETKRLYTYLGADGAPIGDWYENIMPFVNGYAPAKKKHKYGFVNQKLEETVAFTFSDVQVLNKERYVGQMEGARFVLLNTEGRVLSEIYSGFENFDKDYLLGIAVEEYKGSRTLKKALFTHQGKQVSNWYNEIYPKTNNYYRILSSERFYSSPTEYEVLPVYNYIIDSTGEVLSTWRVCHEIKWEAKQHRTYKDSVVKYLHQPNTDYVITDDFWKTNYFLDFETERHSLRFEGGNFHDGMALVSKVVATTMDTNKVGDISFMSKKVKYGFIDWNGRLVINYKYDYISGFSDGKAVFRKNGKFGVIDYRGNIIMQPKFDLLSNFGSGIAPYYADSVWGYTTARGKVAIAPKYDEALPHRYGYAAVKIKKKWGLIDTRGNLVIDPIYRKPPKAISNRKVKVLNDGVGYEVIPIEK